MKGHKALKKIRQGCTARRQSWATGVYVSLRLGHLDQFNEIRWVNGNSIIYQWRPVDATEFLADDWEVVE